MASTQNPDMTPSLTQQYEPGEHPDWPAPSSVKGPVAWMRENLFGSVTNTVLTLLAVYLIYKIVPALADWMFLDAVFTGESRKDCRAQGDGACWAFISGRIQLFIYGFYPDAERWRVNLTAVLLVFALVPILFDKVPHRGKALIYSALYPVIAGVLLVGGIFGLEYVSTDQFGGLMLNVIIGVTGIAFSLPIGICLALGRQSHLPIIRILSVSFIEFIRGVPLITLLFVASSVLNYFFPPGTALDLILRVVIMATLFSSAYMAEVIRGGLAALPQGQYEAADSLGLDYWKSMRLIILPQALKISIPGIVNTFIGLFKDTTLVSVIGLLDPVGMITPIRADSNWNGLVWEFYVFVALFFFAFCFCMSRYSMYLEKKLKTDNH
mgnify:CR=1 FL=1